MKPFRILVASAQIASAIAATQLASGCAVYMAAEGDTHTVTAADGTTQTYGKEPSALRAVGHGFMDVMTLGLWEVIGTPGELIAQSAMKDTPVSK